MYKNELSNTSYSGVREIFVDGEVVQDISQHGFATLPGDISCKLSPNEFLLLKIDKDDRPTIVRYIGDGHVAQHTKIDSILPARNKEQSWAYELLHDKNIKLVTLTGPAGTGKTLLALAAAKQQLGDGYKKIVITRPIVPLGKDIGHLPGTIEEKMNPWIAPLRDNLNFLLETSQSGKQKQQKQVVRDLDYMFKNRIIEIEAVTYIRGRSLPNAFIIVDEAQNLDIASLKTIITRVGDGTKIVLTGDMDQVDQRLAAGLPTVIEKFRPHKIAAHISLIKGERSELATLASQIL